MYESNNSTAALAPLEILRQLRANDNSPVITARVDYTNWPAPRLHFSDIDAPVSSDCGCQTNELYWPFTIDNASEHVYAQQHDDTHLCDYICELGTDKGICCNRPNRVDMTIDGHY